MISKKQILKLENRRAIYNFIDKHPGLHKREIIRKFKLSEGTVRYHINHLRKNGFISEEIESGYTRYYVTDKVGRVEKEMLGALRREIPRKIIIFGLISFVFSKVELSRELEKDTKTIYYHLKRLKKMDIIESVIAKDGIIQSNRNGCIYEHHSARREILYQIKDPYLMYHLLIKYKNTFLGDQDTKNFLEFLEEISKGSPKGRYKRRSVDEVADKVFYDLFPFPFCA